MNGYSFLDINCSFHRTTSWRRSKARAAIFKTTAHASVARRAQEVHYRVLTDSYAGTTHGGCCPICQTIYQRDTTERTRHTYWDCRTRCC